MRQLHFTYENKKYSYAKINETISQHPKI